MRKEGEGGEREKERERVGGVGEGVTRGLMNFLNF